LVVALGLGLIPHPANAETTTNQVSSSANEEDNSYELASDFLREIAEEDRGRNRKRWSFFTNISSSFERQKLDTRSADNRSADIATLSLQNYLSTGNWLFGTNIPWKNADDNGLNFRSSQICNRISNAIEQPQTFDINTFPRLANFFNSECFGLEGSERGIADVSVFANYKYSLGSGSPYISFSSDLKWDNANIEKRLGTGTRELRNQLQLVWNFKSYSSELSAGHTTFIGGELEDFYNNFYDLSARLKKAISPTISIATSLNWLEASDQFNVDDLLISADAQFELSKHWYCSVQASHYLERDSVIQQSYRGSVTYSF